MVEKLDRTIKSALITDTKEIFIESQRTVMNEKHYSFSPLIYFLD